MKLTMAFPGGSGGGVRFEQTTRYSIKLETETSTPPATFQIPVPYAAPAPTDDTVSVHLSPPPTTVAEVQLQDQQVQALLAGYLAKIEAEKERVDSPMASPVITAKTSPLQCEEMALDSADDLQRQYQTNYNEFLRKGRDGLDLGEDVRAMEEVFLEEASLDLSEDGEEVKAMEEVFLEGSGSEICGSEKESEIESERGESVKCPVMVMEKEWRALLAGEP